MNVYCTCILSYSYNVCNCQLSDVILVHYFFFFFFFFFYSQGRQCRANKNKNNIVQDKNNNKSNG